MSEARATYEHRSIAVLTNPSAGKGRAGRLTERVLARLRDAGYAARSLSGRDADEAADLARGCVADGVDTLVVVGGDGMVHTVLPALAGGRTRLGLVPAGTGNDVARTLGVPRGGPEAAADVVLGGRERRVDLARVGHRYFLTVLAAGFDAVVNERANRMRHPRGQLRYTLATLAEMPTFRPIPYAVELDGEQQRFQAMLVAVGNGPSFGGGLRIAHGAEVDDGRLDVAWVGPVPKRTLLRLYPQLPSGGHVTHPAYRSRRVQKVTIAAPGIVAYADGERLGPLPLSVEAAPSALRVLVP